MPSIGLHIKCSKNSKLVLSSNDLLSLYLYGIDTKSKDGSVIPEHVYRAYIMDAQQEIEKYLGIKLIRQVIEEDHHYHGTDWFNWSLIQTSYQVESPISLIGYYGKTKHITVPTNWMTSKASSDGLYHRAVWMVPNGSGNIQTTPVVLGVGIPFLGADRNQSVPDYWKLRYVTGFKTMPMDLVGVIGKIAAINVLNQLSDLILGAGVSSRSIGIDGISQSVSANSDGYGRRVKAWISEIDAKLIKLREFYTGIRMTCV